jgi:hypothetical protein
MGNNHLGNRKGGVMRLVDHQDLENAAIFISESTGTAEEAGVDRQQMIDWMREVVLNGLEPGVMPTETAMFVAWAITVGIHAERSRIDREAQGPIAPFQI